MNVSIINDHCYKVLPKRLLLKLWWLLVLFVFSRITHSKNQVPMYLSVPKLMAPALVCRPWVSLHATKVAFGILSCSALVRSDTWMVSTWTVGIAVCRHVLHVFFFFFVLFFKPNTTLTKVYWEICLQWPDVVLHMGPTVETGGFLCACSTPQLPSIHPLQLITFNTNALLYTNYIHPWKNWSNFRSPNSGERVPNNFPKHVLIHHPSLLLAHSLRNRPVILPPSPYRLTANKPIFLWLTLMWSPKPRAWHQIAPKPN